MHGGELNPISIRAEQTHILEKRIGNCVVHIAHFLRAIIGSLWEPAPVSSSTHVAADRKGMHSSPAELVLRKH